MADKNQHDPFKTFKDFFGNQKWITTVEKQFEQQYKNVVGSFDKNFKKAVSNFNLITSKELEKLEKRINELEKKLGIKDTKKKPGTKKTTTKKPTTKKAAKPKSAAAKGKVKKAR